MKSTLLTLACVTLASAAMAADPEKGTPISITLSDAGATTSPGTLTPDGEIPLQSSSPASLSTRDGITFSAGRVMLTRNGVSSPLDKEMTLGNGTRIRPDGSMTRSDGVQHTLSLDQHLTFDGGIAKEDTGRQTSPQGAGEDSQSVKTGGTHGMDKTSADRGEAEAQRRTNAAVENATVSDPKSSAK